jgi:hypothetical protein
MSDEPIPSLAEAMAEIRRLRARVAELEAAGAIQRGTLQMQTQQLRDAGIPGIKYLDQGSRGKGEGTSNYVVFDANTINILRKYGIAGLMAGGGAAAATGTQQQSQ